MSVYTVSNAPSRPAKAMGRNKMGTQIKRGYDALKQNWFISFWSLKWHLLLAFHKRWKFYYIRLDGAKDDTRRFYIGPLEIEWRIS